MSRLPDPVETVPPLQPLTEVDEVVADFVFVVGVPRSEIPAIPGLVEKFTVPPRAQVTLVTTGGGAFFALATPPPTAPAAIAPIGTAAAAATISSLRIILAPCCLHGCHGSYLRAPDDRRGNPPAQVEEPVRRLSPLEGLANRDAPSGARVLDLIRRTVTLDRALPGQSIRHVTACTCGSAGSTASGPTRSVPIHVGDEMSSIRSGRRRLQTPGSGERNGRPWSNAPTIRALGASGGKRPLRRTGTSSRSAPDSSPKRTRQVTERVRTRWLFG